ncbi:AraC family transcriptional regulator [uncultured Muriicola sp.]|uniref:helix-turn-helix domain-containing protein n=1 Tax=uncultured Muriicola sp. TaxID=1583102 RepID=UPI00262670D7|nr:helix-turn-helix domain-containing protein [uncultured Muriicola sp.]
MGILLLILNYRHFRSTYFLGLFLLLFSLKLAIFIPKGLNIDQLYPELFLLPFNFSWLLFPIFFIYTQKVSIFSDQKIKYWLLYPGILSIALQLIIYFLPYSTKLVIAQSFWHELVFTILGISYSWVIGIWNLKLLNQHRTEVQNTFSFLENKVLLWVRIFLIYSLSTSVLIHILYYVSPDNYYFKILFSIFDLIAIYWIAVNGVIQQNVLSILAKKESGIPSQYTFAMENDQRKIVNEKDLKTLMEEIDSYMKTTEAFLLSELTIIDLAEKLNIHPKKISTSINKILHQNFNSYVNQLRIKKAETLLKDQSSNYFSIEGISKEVGFHSKSAFYEAFKKVTGTTPNKYKERNSE